jgi:hypothetical protein
MFTVLDHGTQVFSGYFSEMNTFVIERYGSHQAAILAGARIMPPASNL